MSCLTTSVEIEKGRRFIYFIKRGGAIFKAFVSRMAGLSVTIENPTVLEADLDALNGDESLVMIPEAPAADYLFCQKPISKSKNSNLKKNK